MNELMGQSLTTERAISQLSAFFGLLALALASIGLYGVMAYNATRRTNEIGIRVALGVGRVALRPVPEQARAAVAVACVFWTLSRRHVARPSQCERHPWRCGSGSKVHQRLML